MTLMVRVEALLAAIAGAKNPVLRGDGWRANPARADRIRAYVVHDYRIPPKP